MTRSLFLFSRILYKNYGVNFTSRNSYISSTKLLISAHNCVNANITSNRINCKRYSSHEYGIAKYEEVKEIGANKRKNVLLIDVREPEELSETGALPSSINIPLGDLENALKSMPEKEFLKVYGIEKPDKSFPIIFSCKSGRRSATACETSQQLGFKNVKNYSGGWTEWSERSG